MSNLRSAVPRFAMAPSSYDPNNEQQFRRDVERALQDALASVPRPPKLESVDLTFDGDSATLSLKVVGGADLQSVLFEIADNASFTSPLVSETVNMTEGVVHTESSAALAEADLGTTYYARATPYAGKDATVLDGTPLQDAEYAPPPTATKTPRFTDASFANTVQGTCSTSLKLKNRITVAFMDVLPGYTWSVVRYENGDPSTSILVASGIALTTTTQDDEIDVESDPLGTSIDYSYRVQISSGGVVDTAWTQTQTIPVTACP